MREIKFRAWKKSESRMIYWAELIEDPKRCIDALTGVYLRAVMQFTGLRDRRGREIYEGDIVQIKAHWSKTMPLIQEVIYEAATFLPFDDSDWGWVSSGSEVIGNIYENPELLEGK